MSKTLKNIKFSFKYVLQTLVIENLIHNIYKNYLSNRVKLHNKFSVISQQSLVDAEPKYKFTNTITSKRGQNSLNSFAFLSCSPIFLCSSCKFLRVSLARNIDLIRLNVQGDLISSIE